jgi:hypothetical protein
MKRAILILGLAFNVGCKKDSATTAPEPPKPVSDVTLNDLEPLSSNWRKIVVQWDGSMSKVMPEPIKTVLEQATEFELSSLHPWESPTGKYVDSYEERRELGKVRISEPEARKVLLAALSRGLDEGEEMADCFAPRHRIRIVRDGKTYDVTICFECGAVETYVDGELNRNYAVAVGGSPEPILNAFLVAAKIPIPPSVFNGDDE